MDRCTPSVPFDDRPGAKKLMKAILPGDAVEIEGLLAFGDNVFGMVGIVDGLLARYASEVRIVRHTAPPAIIRRGQTEMFGMALFQASSIARTFAASNWAGKRGEQEAKSEDAP